MAKRVSMVVSPAATPIPAPVATPAPAASPVEAKPVRWSSFDCNANPNAVITVLTRNADGSIRNPKLAGKAPALRFAKYVDGITVSAAIKAGVWAKDIQWDLQHGYIAVAAPKA